MPRTTLNLDEVVLRQIKRRALAEGRAIQDFTNELLKQALARPRAATRPYRLDLRGWNATELPGVDIRDRDTLYEVMGGRIA